MDEQKEEALESPYRLFPDDENKDELDRPHQLLDVDEPIPQEVDTQLLETRQTSCHIKFKANLLDMCGSSSSTLIWETLFYAPTFSSPAVTYAVKIPAMGLLPNIPGMLFASAAEHLRTPYIIDKKTHLKQFSKDYLLIYFLIDLLYQPLQDSVHSLDAKEWEGLAETFYTTKQIILNIILMGGGLSILHYYLTKWIRGADYQNWKESATVGPQYFFFWLSDYFLNGLADKYHLQDETVDFAGSAICTGLATFGVNTCYDLIDVCVEKSFRLTVYQRRSSYNVTVYHVGYYETGCCHRSACAPCEYRRACEPCRYPSRCQSRCNNYVDDYYRNDMESYDRSTADDTYPEYN